MDRPLRGVYHIRVQLASDTEPICNFRVEYSLLQKPHSAADCPIRAESPLLQVPLTVDCHGTGWTVPYMTNLEYLGLPGNIKVVIGGIEIQGTQELFTIPEPYDPSIKGRHAISTHSSTCTLRNVDGLCCVAAQ